MTNPSFILIALTLQVTLLSLVTLQSHLSY